MRSSERVTFSCLVLSLCLALGGTASAAEAFIDSFETLDLERWYVSDGWVNGTHQGCIWKSSQVAAVDGTLRFTVEREPQETPDGQQRDHVCGEVQTRRAFGPGLYETQLRAAKGAGLLFAFFTYTGPVHDNPHDEIDVEIAGRDTKRVEANYFVAGRGNHTEKIELDVPADADFVHYAFDWSPDALRWYVNGVLVHEVTGGELPSHEQRIYLSFWNGTSESREWLGEFETGTAPVTAEIDWVGYTPPGQRCAFAQSVSCRSGWSAPLPDDKS